MRNFNKCSDTNVPDTRIRFKFLRTEAAAGTAHSMQIKEFRRRAAASGLPFCGNNTPKMSFGPALAEGCASRCEFADLYLCDYVAEDEAFNKMIQLDDENYKVVSAERIPVFFPTVDSAVNAVKYSAFSDEPVFSESKLQYFLKSESCLCERIKSSGKTQIFNVRELCVSAEIKDAGKRAEFVIKVSQGANLRPEDAVKSIFGISREGCGPDKAFQIERIELFWINSRGELEVF